MELRHSRKGLLISGDWRRRYGVRRFIRCQSLRHWLGRQPQVEVLNTEWGISACGPGRWAGWRRVCGRRGRLVCGQSGRWLEVGLCGRRKSIVSLHRSGRNNIRRWARRQGLRDCPRRFGEVELHNRRKRGSVSNPGSRWHRLRGLIRRQAVRHRRASSHADTDPNRNSDAYSVPNSHAHSITDSDEYADSDAKRYAYAFCHRHCDSNSDC